MTTLSDLSTSLSSMSAMMSGWTEMLQQMNDILDRMNGVSSPSSSSSSSSTSSATPAFAATDASYAATPSTATPSAPTPSSAGSVVLFGVPLACTALSSPSSTTLPEYAAPTPAQTPLSTRTTAVVSTPSMPSTVSTPPTTAVGISFRLPTPPFLAAKKKITKTMLLGYRRQDKDASIAKEADSEVLVEQEQALPLALPWWLHSPRLRAAPPPGSASDSAPSVLPSSGSTSSSSSQTVKQPADAAVQFHRGCPRLRLGHHDLHVGDGLPAFGLNGWTYDLGYRGALVTGIAVRVFATAVYLTSAGARALAG